MKTFTRMMMALLLSLPVLFTSCKKDDDPQPVYIETPDNQRSAELELTVTYHGVPIADAEVWLYKSEADMENGIFEVARDETNSKGKVGFRELKAETLYVKVVKGSHTNVVDGKADKIELRPGKRTTAEVVLPLPLPVKYLTQKPWVGNRIIINNTDKTQERDFKSTTIVFSLDERVQMNSSKISFNSFWRFNSDYSELIYYYDNYSVLKLNDSEMVLQRTNGATTQVEYYVH